MDIFPTMQHLRNTALPFHAYFGLRSMFGDENAKFVEFGIGSSLQQFWPLCSQLLVVSASKALVLTDSEATLWTQAFDTVMSNELQETIGRLKWKPSKNGG